VVRARCGPCSSACAARVLGAGSASTGALVSRPRRARCAGERRSCAHERTGGAGRRGASGSGTTAARDADSSERGARPRGRERSHARARAWVLHVPVVEPTMARNPLEQNLVDMTRAPRDQRPAPVRARAATLPAKHARSVVSVSEEDRARPEAMAPKSGRAHSGPRHDWPPTGPSHATPPWSATWGLPGTWTHTAARMCSAPRNAIAPARPNRSPKPEADPRKVQS
jgi:hypothetical protein